MLINELKTEINTIRAEAERDNRWNTSRDVRLFIDDLITALDKKETDYGYIPVTELREQQRLH
jgi:hypothetical protein